VDSSGIPHLPWLLVTIQSKFKKAVPRGRKERTSLPHLVLRFTDRQERKIADARLKNVL